MADSAASSGVSVAQILTWLTQRVAHYVEREIADIDVNAPLAEYGLDSLYAYALCGEIEDDLRLPVEPTVVWDFGTVGALAAHLCALTQAGLVQR